MRCDAGVLCGGMQGCTVARHRGCGAAGCRGAVRREAGMLCGGTQSGQVQGCSAAGRGDVCRRGSAPMTTSLGTPLALAGEPQ